MKLQRVEIAWQEGFLNGLLYLPDCEVRASAVVLTHGLTAGKYGMDALASALALKGYPALAYDLAGHKLGATGGEMHYIRQAVENVEAAAQYMKETLQMQKLVLAGHSLGGLCSLAAAARYADAVVCITAGTEPLRGFSGAVGKAMLQQRGDYVAGANLYALLEQLNAMVEHLPPLPPQLPALFIAGRHDVLVTPQQVEDLRRRLTAKADFLLADTTHMEAPAKCRSSIVGWLIENRF